MDEVLKDDRFSHIAKDPRFWEMPKNEKKVKIDKRFKAMFTDKRFQVKYTVDKRGRPIDTSSKDNLRRYYDVSDSDKEEDDNVDSNKKPKKKKEKNRKDNLSKEIAEKPKGKKKNCRDVDSVQKVKVKSDDQKINLKKVGKKGNNQTKKIKKSQKNKSTKFEINMNEDDDEEQIDEEESDDDDDVDSEEDKDVKTQRTGKSVMEINMNEEEDEASDQDKNSSSSNGEDDESDEDEYSEDDDSDYDGSDEEVDRARGIGGVTSSSSEEEYEFDGDDTFDHNWMEMDKNVPEAKDSSHRLAVCNLDWDRIKAEDVYLMLNSFKPSNGYIQSVTIYPSEYGLQRMKEEELQGPKELVQKTDNDLLLSSKKIEDDEEFNRERLRQYQINRLKYYYAVVVCDSVSTATKLYDECDGLEFETSCTKIDLRFIPDDMTFEQEPKSICTGVEEYKPNYFANSALGSSKVQLTWDDTDHDRLRVTMTKVDPKKIADMEKDYENYIASSSDEDAGDRIVGSGSSDSNSDGENEESRLQKYRQLIQEIDEKKAKNEEEEVEMEITWEPGLKETAETLVKQSAEAEKTETPWQNFLKKKKEKKKQKVKERKEAKQRALIESGEAPEEKEAFSDDELPAGVDLNDPYFKSEIKDVQTSKKKKKGMKEELTEEELEKRKQDEAKLKLLMMDEDDHRNHFSLDKLVKDAKKTKKKKKKKFADDEDDTEQPDDFQVDVTDPRFSALYESHLFNVDPSAPEFKKTKGSQLLIKEKQKRRQKEGYFKPTNLKRKATDSENKDTSTTSDYVAPKESVSSLVRSVKAKTQKFQESKKKKS